MTGTGEVVLILGSGPTVLRARDWPKAWVDRIVAINNAWAVREDWDDLVFPEDFPEANMPPDPAEGRRLVGADAFVPAQNRYGGFVFAGATMAFTAAYWALDALRPRVLAFMGCDMVYAPAGRTHFYGKGMPDPLRADISLRDLKAKSARLGMIAAAQGCACVNLSDAASQLVFPRAAPADLRRMPPPPKRPGEVDALRSQEAALGYDTPDGRHDATGAAYDRAALAALDTAWRRLFDATF